MAMKGGCLASLIILFILLFTSTTTLSTSVLDIDAAGFTNPQRPMIFQYPDVQTSPGPGVVTEGHEDDLRLWCESWRLAGEANNLSPWKTIPPECAVHVRDYMQGRAYLFDIEMVSKEAAAYARTVAHVGADAMDAWIFDVDDTLISNLPYYAEHHYGLEIFDHHEFDKWVQKGRAPPLISSLKLYEDVLSMGFKVILLTGRKEGHRTITVENLTRAGYHDWDRLILRTTEDQNKPATVYKSEKRTELVKEGFKLLGNSGDQWTDLLGDAVSSRSFKVPNPMYYIP